MAVSTVAHSGVPPVLSWGLGADSTAILVRWLVDPCSRNFDLADLIVLHASTGNEFAETGRLCEAHVLPLLRDHGVRTIQVARAGRSAARDGIVFLEDSRTPERIYAEGAYTLAEENLSNGTMPLLSSRRCSVKAKGEVLDAAVGAVVGDREYRAVIGFEANEVRRAERDKGFGTSARRSEYPLIEWGWDRQACHEFLAEITGVVRWPKSACVYCPFTKASERDVLMERYRAEPAAGALAVVMERMAMRFNPMAGRLFGTVAVEDLVRAAGLDDVVALADAEFAGAWAAYRVRRIRHQKARVWRSVRIEATGTRTEMEAQVRSAAEEAGGELDAGDGVERWWIHRAADSFPTWEEFVVAAPVGVEDKERPGFQEAWGAVTGRGRLFAWGAAA